MVSLFRKQKTAIIHAKGPGGEDTMDFDFSEDQKFLKNEARKFLDALSPVSVVRSVLDDPDKSYDSKLWKAVAEQGWLGAAIAEEHGGLGLGGVELCAIAEEL